MTIEELKIAKELYDKVVAVITRANESCNSADSNMDNTNDTRIRIQYEASLTDPRRI